ncbi:MAG TPA: hypothetical protein VKD23_14610 [Terriglobales bacterium]|nr:hypothetical protein [Terriglobales bacterium]
MIENIIAIIAASGGIILMIGSLVLLYQGRITLQAIHEKVQEGKEPADGTGGDALAVEIGQIKIKSQYPTIALFLVAVGCFWLALQYGKGQRRMVSGILTDPDAKDYTVAYTGVMGVAYPDNTGQFEQEVPEDVHLVVLEIAKGGKEPQKFPLYPSKEKEWPVKFELKAPTGPSATPAAKLEVNPAQVAEVGKALPPLKAQ